MKLVPTVLEEDGNLVRHAARELELAGFFDEDSDYGPELGAAILDVVREFAQAGHSGGSAAVTVAVLEKLLRFQPLTPLTSNPDEWNRVDADEPGVWQNRRRSDAFSTDGGQTWYYLDEDGPYGLPLHREDGQVSFDGFEWGPLET